MRSSDKQLAIRTKGVSATPAREIVYKHEHPQTQYVVHHTVLGEFALSWSAHWLAGLFCLNDFPPEWLAYVQNVVLGPRYESIHPCGESTFNDSLYEVMRAGGPYAAVAEALIRGNASLQLALPD